MCHKEDCSFLLTHKESVDIHIRLPRPSGTFSEGKKNYGRCNTQVTSRGRRGVGRHVRNDLESKRAVTVFAARRQNLRPDSPYKADFLPGAGGHGRGTPEPL